MITLFRKVYQSIEHDALTLYYTVKDIYFPPKCKFCSHKMEPSKIGNMIIGSPIFSNLKPRGSRLWVCPSCFSMFNIISNEWINPRQSKGKA